MIDADLICSGALLALAAVVLLAYGVRSTARSGKGTSATTRPGLPGWVKELAQWALEPVVRWVVRAGISASSITGMSLVLGTGSGVLLALGHFGIAGIVLVVASLGDTVDGAVARRTKTATPAGALFDSSVDRYQEFFVLGGIAMFFRANAIVVALVLVSLLGSFMVSYGSAKAEAFRVVVPPGWMRRAERAVCVSAGTILVPPAGAVARAFGLPDWTEYTPVWLALGLVAVVANISAVVRLRAIAVAASELESRGGGQGC
jgi:CDP-diacylglycerol--glycerol-3-phosphate 3-phosphatidyltransferase